MQLDNSISSIKTKYIIINKVINAIKELKFFQLVLILVEFPFLLKLDYSFNFLKSEHKS